MKYASRVQRVSLFHDDLESWFRCLSLFKKMVSTQPCYTFPLPAARDLCIIAGHNLPHIPRLINPLSLRRLTIEGASFMPPLGAACFCITASQALLLQYLEVSGPTVSTFLDPVVGLRHLRILNIQNIRSCGESSTIIRVYQDLIRILSTLDTLVELRFPLEFTVDRIPECVGFQHLEVLHTQSCPSTVARFVNTVTSTSLHTVTVNAHSAQPSIHSWKRLIEVLCIRHDLSLRVLHITSPHGIEFPVFVSELQYLEEVQLSVPTIMSIADAQTLASAWSNLTSLDLYVSHWSHNLRITCSIECLVPFARLCPRLTILKVCLDGKALPEVSTFPRLQHRLRSLQLTANMTDYFHLATLLDTLFPNLRSVNIHPPLYLPILVRGKPWEDVPQFISAFQSARKTSSLRTSTD